MSIIIAALIVDTSFIRIYPFIVSQPLSSWRIVLFSIIAIMYVIGQYFILEFVKKKSKEIKTKKELNLEILHKSVTVAQYVLTAILVIVILQMFATSRYNIVMLTAATSISYALAIIMMGLLAKRFFSWFKSSKNSVIFFYGLSSAILAINLGFTLVFASVILVDLPPYVLPHRGETMVPFIAPGSAASMLNNGFVISSIMSFILSWIATALLLQQYSQRLGMIRYWIIISIPLAYFLMQFQSLLNINFLTSLLQLSPVSFSTLYTLFFTLSQPAGGILFGIAFWAVARSVRHSNAVRDYMIISAYGLVLLFTSNEAVVLLNRTYPPFGLATISFVGLSSYLILLGVYSAAISVAQDAKLRQSIRKSVQQESKLLGSIGTSQMEQQLQSRVIKMSKEYRDRMTEKSGLESSLSDSEIKEYLNSVVEEVRKKKK